MTRSRNRSRAGMVAGLALVAGLGAAVAKELPEIQRYLKIRSM